MDQNALFRQEVIDNRKYTGWGQVFINTPTGFQFSSSILFTLMLIIILFLFLGEFSEKHIVSGYISSDKGSVRVFPIKNGIIKKSYVSPGKKIKKNDLLFIIDTSYGSTEKQDSSILSQLLLRKKAYEDEINYKLNQLSQIKKLLDKKYISLDTYNKKHEEIIALKSSLDAIKTDLIKYRQDKSYIIKAPITGTIASVIFKPGQYINATKPLLKIVPLNANLEVELFIPVRKSGFIRPNDQVIIHYDAYPYERFGTYKAIIKNISQSILIDEEDDKPIKIREPYYKATATLISEEVQVYGKNVTVHDGMTVTGVVLGAKRTVGQWILDPIYSFYGKATA